MGEQAVKILNLDVHNLIETLNVALAEEWLAYYQYWIGARIMEGPMRSEIEPELLKHANEELKHAEKLAERIIQLEGTPLIDPHEWFSYAKCRYEPPVDLYIGKILEQNLTGERCAINRYQGIANMTNGIDYNTHQIATDILGEELEHEHDLTDYLKDLKIMREKFLETCSC